MVSFPHGYEDAERPSLDVVETVESDARLALPDNLIANLNWFLLIASLLCGLYMWLASGDLATGGWTAAVVLLLATACSLPFRRRP